MLPIYFILNLTGHWIFPYQFQYHSIRGGGGASLATEIIYNVHAHVSALLLRNYPFLLQGGKKQLDWASCSMMQTLSPNTLLIIRGTQNMTLGLTTGRTKYILNRNFEYTNTIYDIYKSKIFFL